MDIFFFFLRLGWGAYFLGCSDLGFLDCIVCLLVLLVLFLGCCGVFVLFVVVFFLVWVEFCYLLFFLLDGVFVFWSVVLFYLGWCLCFLWCYGVGLFGDRFLFSFGMLLVKGCLELNGVCDFYFSFLDEKEEVICNIIMLVIFVLWVRIWVIFDGVK